MTDPGIFRRGSDPRGSPGQFFSKPHENEMDRPTGNCRHPLPLSPRMHFGNLHKSPRGISISHQSYSKIQMTTECCKIPSFKQQFTTNKMLILRRNQNSIFKSLLVVEIAVSIVFIKVSKSKDLTSSFFEMCVTPLS